MPARFEFAVRFELPLSKSDRVLEKCKFSNAQSTSRVHAMVNKRDRTVVLYERLHPTHASCITRYTSLLQNVVKPWFTVRELFQDTPGPPASRTRANLNSSLLFTPNHRVHGQPNRNDNAWYVELVLITPIHTLQRRYLGIQYRRRYSTNSLTTSCHVVFPARILYA